MADWITETRSWKPGEHLSGDIDLSEEFEDLLKTLDRDDVVVSWIYRPERLFVAESALSDCVWYGQLLLSRN